MSADSSVSRHLVSDGLVDHLTTELEAEADPNEGHITELVLGPNVDGDGDPIDGGQKPS